MCRNHGPKSSLFWPVVGDEKRYPAGCIFGVFHLTAYAVTEAATLVDSLPVNLRMPEAGLEQDLADLRNRPQAPIIRESAPDSAPVVELEVDVEAREVVHRVVVVELPQVGETAVARPLR